MKLKNWKRWLKHFCARVLDRDTITDIETGEFDQMVKQLMQLGWQKVGEYDGFNAWIDYGLLKLRKDGETLTLEWDNSTGGSIRGPRRIIKALRSAQPTAAPNQGEL